MSVVLSEHLPLLATAPDGIQKLRGLILELAVRGKLVPQDPNDEPASELLKRIAKERARLEASKEAPDDDAQGQRSSRQRGWAMAFGSAMWHSDNSGKTLDKGRKPVRHAVTITTSDYTRGHFEHRQRPSRCYQRRRILRTLHDCAETIC